MTTRLQTQSAIQDGRCITPDCDFFQVSSDHFLCSGCAGEISTKDWDAIAKRAMYDMNIEFAGQVDFSCMRGVLVQESTNAMHLMSQALESIACRRNGEIVLFSARQITQLRNKIHQSIIWWTEPHHTKVIDAILVSVCYNPWKVDKDTFAPEAFCYFGNHGEPFCTVTSAAQHFGGAYCVAFEKDTVGRDLFSFCRPRLST